MKKLFTIFSLLFVSMSSVQAQCDLDFNFVNTGTNMTAFFTPPAASAIHNELGDGTIGSFYTDADGSLICGASVAFNGSQIQLAIMADDTATDSPEKDGFSSGESINWFYETLDGSLFSITPNPNDNFAINAISVISSASVESVDCGGDDTSSDNQCPALDFSFVNTGSNMTLFITPPGAAALSGLGNGTIGVYFDVDGQEVCGGASAFSGSQVQITAMADDTATDSPEKDGFSAGETIVWKFEDNDGNQYDLTPTPQDVFAINGISFISGIAYDAISCAVDLEGCTDDAYVEYNPQASIDDGSCTTLVVEGCTDSNYAEYNANANVDNGSCTTLIVEGCTDANFVEYDSTANIDDGSCTTLVVEGCTDSNSSNFNSSANTNDGSCEYDLIGAGCSVSFIPVENSGNNHTVFITPAATEGTPLSSGDNIGVFYVSADGSAQCAGSSVWNGNQLQITVFGDDATTDEIDGFTSGVPLLLLAQSGDNVYVVSATYQTPSMSTFVVNGLSFVTLLDFESACTVEYLGCTDENACNYDATANTDNGSCSYPEEYYNCAGSCLSDIDADGVCDALELGGCTDVNASNYDASATDEDDSCISWQEAYEACISSGGDDGITQDDLDAVQDLLDAANLSLTNAEVNIISLENELSAALENQEDGVTQSDLDAVQAQLNASVNQVESLNVVIANLEDDLALANNLIVSLEAQIDEILANCGDDGITQADVDAAYAAGAASVIPEDGITQADLDQANIQIIELQSQLEEALANGGSCEPIYIDLLQGWNIIGYTLSFPQDVAATMASIVEDVQIVKNNAAQVFWPEFGFNGIGDFTPGLGYQIRMFNAVNAYTLPDVGGERLEMINTVPAWVYDLPVLNHPNDTKSLVKVVNMLGQEVNPEEQFVGEILLYLYSDGSTEKLIVE